MGLFFPHTGIPLCKSDVLEFGSEKYGNEKINTDRLRKGDNRKEMKKEFSMDGCSKIDTLQEKKGRRERKKKKSSRTFDERTRVEHRGSRTDDGRRETGKRELQGEGE